MSDPAERERDRLIGRVVASSFSNITDSIIDTHSALKVAAITLTAEFGVLAMFVIAREKLVESLSEMGDDFWAYGSVAVFANGFLIAFAMYRLFAERWRYAWAHIVIWIISVAAGVFNLFLFFVLLN